MKSTILIALLLSSLLIMAGCSTTSAEPETIRLGAILPQTGPVAQAGEFVQHGIDLALEEINSEGGVDGKPLEIIFEDSQCNPKQAVSSFHKLTDVDSVSAIVGPFCSGSTMAIAPLTTQNKIVVLSPGSTTPELTDAGDYVFRVTPSDIYEADFIKKHFEQNYDSVAILQVNNKWGVDMLVALKNALGDRIKHVESYTPDDGDVRVQITKIKKSKPQALMVLAYPTHYDMITQQVLEQDIEVPLFAAHTFETPASFALGKDAERWTYVTQSYDSTSVETSSFISRYEEKYGTVPSVWAAFSYDATLILSDALSVCGENAECIKEELYKIQNYQGVSGTKSYDKNGDIKNPVYQWKTVRDGKFVSVE